MQAENEMAMFIAKVACIITAFEEIGSDARNLSLPEWNGLLIIAECDPTFTLDRDTKKTIQRAIDETTRVMGKMDQLTPKLAEALDGLLEYLTSPVQAEPPKNVR